MSTAAAATTKPRWRGVFHEISVFLFAPLFVAIGRAAHTNGARAAVAVYGLAVLSMFGVSAIYHRGTWSPPARRRLKRLDHSTILLAIAGTYTAVAGIGLDGRTRALILGAVWFGAIAGIAIRMLWIDAPRPLTAGVYVVVGWVAVLALPALYRALGASAFALVVLGGVLYTTGAVAYARKRPDPVPAVFGYHEVFHAFVCAAALCHVAAVAILVTRSR